jgi:hypothetical protein
LIDLSFALHGAPPGYFFEVRQYSSRLSHPASTRDALPPPSRSREKGGADTELQHIVTIGGGRTRAAVTGRGFHDKLIA